MARSMRDVLELEDRGVRTVALHTEAFRSAAEAHARSLGRTGFPGSVFLRHPVAALDRESVYRRVDEALPALVAALLGDSGV